MKLNYTGLEGRPFEIGTHDCFDMVLSMYALNFGIKLTKYARPNNWRADNIDIIGLSYEREGFHKVMDWTLATLRPGDILCMAIGSSKANHMAVYIGENQIIHHKDRSFSNVETLRDFWRRSICYVLRHKDVNIEPEVKPEVQLKDLIDERNRIQSKKTV
jgi:cell wall-associated NlpC family hydrolase